MRMPVIILSFAMLTIASCGETSTSLGVEYDIIKEVPNTRLSKDNLDIRLSKKIDERVLSEIATKLRRDRKQYDRLWIFYYLPDMDMGAGAWAITHFTPDLEIRIIGATEKEDEALDAVTVKADVIIGKWRDNRPMGESTMIIFRKARKLKLKTTFWDGSASEEALVEKKENGRTRYDYAKYFHGEYFILESNKNLGMYGRDGKFGEAKRTR